MADPRKTIRHDNIKVTEVAYKNDSSIVFDDTKQGGSASVGLAVTLSADKTVGLAGDGEVVIGRLERVYDDGICSVRIGGHMTFKGGTSATLTRGGGIVGALRSSAKGYVKVASGGRGYVQANTDTDAVEVMFP